MCVYFHDILFLGRLIAEFFFFFFVIVLYALLKFVFSKALVDLSLCDMVNFVRDSHLHITQEGLGELQWFEGVLYLTCENKQP
jgi:hypothetical protein